MRDFLDAILAFIVAESLTDNEFDSVEATVTIYDQATYDDLARILTARGSATVYLDRLLSYYEARGVSLTAATVANSNIFIGGVLE
jgi:hypothetical protein